MCVVGCITIGIGAGVRDLSRSNGRPAAIFCRRHLLSPPLLARERARDAMRGQPRVKELFLVA
eukprot:8962943-Lingulodinium_polyedra.AAC.1